MIIRPYGKGNGHAPLRKGGMLVVGGNAGFVLSPGFDGVFVPDFRWAAGINLHIVNNYGNTGTITPYIAF